MLARDLAVVAQAHVAAFTPPDGHLYYVIRGEHRITLGLDPKTMELVSGLEAQTRRVFENLAAVAQAAGGGLNDIVKLTIYLVDLGEFGRVNEIMASFFTAPFPARATLGVAGLPRGALIEVDAIMHIE